MRYAACGVLRCAFLRHFLSMVDVAAVDVLCFLLAMVSLSVFGMDIVVVDDGYWY